MMTKQPDKHPSTVGGKTPSGRVVTGDPAADPVPSPVTSDPPAAPDGSILLEQADGTYTTHAVEDPQRRRQTIDGQNWEHVGENSAGVWTFRRMP